MTVRTACIAGAALAAAAAGARADLDVTLRLEHYEVLRCERLSAYVTLHNDTDYALVIAGGATNSPASLDFQLEHGNGREVTRRRHPPFVRRLNLSPDQSHECLVDLAKAFNISVAGRYRIRAVCRWEGRLISSKAQVFNVVEGFVLARVTRGLSGYETRPRSYSLRYWRRDGGERLFLCVEDKERMLHYGVFELGPLVRVFEPVLRVERDGSIRVVHQSGRLRYTRSALMSNRDNVWLVDQTYHLEDGRPYPEGAGVAFEAPTGAGPAPGREAEKTKRKRKDGA